MSIPKPSGRKSIHDKSPLNEIKDNVTNYAMETRSKTQGKIQKEAVADKGDANGLSANSSDEYLEQESPDVQKRRKGSSSEEHNTRLRNRQRRSHEVDSSSHEVDSSPSPSQEHHSSYEPESARNNFEQQAKRKGKSDRTSGFGKKENAYTHEPYENNESKTHDSSYKCFTVFIAFIVLMSVSGIALYFCQENEEVLNVIQCEKGNVTCLTENVKEKLKDMKKKYTHQNKDLWRDAYMGIRNIIHEPNKPSIILLLGDKTDDFINCLAVLLGDVSSNALDSGLLRLTPDKFENDMGSVITSLRSSIKNKKAVIVWDLLNINEEALKAFHNLCDRINPLVEEVIYIITIITDDYDKASDPLQFIEKKLYNKLLGKMKEDAIQPLITRITDGPILIVNPEPDIKDCPLPKILK